LTVAGTADYHLVISALQGLDLTAPQATSLETGYLETLASLAAEDSTLDLGASQNPTTEVPEDVESWMSVLDERTLWEDLGGIDWNLFS
jgi:hypothetical protein